jgi:hypothetical protein
MMTRSPVCRLLPGDARLARLSGFVLTRRRVCRKKQARASSLYEEDHRPASLANRGYTLSAEPQAGSPSSVRYEFGCLKCAAFGTFMGMSNPHILHKSFHTRQPRHSTYRNIADDD